MKRFGSVLLSGLVVTVVAACATTNNDMVIGYDCDAGFCSEAPPPVFAQPDAEPEPRGLTQYCPSNHCPTGYTTCSTSTFQCDVDLRSDVRNCGACDAPCPQGVGSDRFNCINGACVLKCRDPLMDCDGLPDNGCEVTAGSDDNNCRVCGDKCADDVPCTDISGYGPTCGCPGDLTLCPDETKQTKGVCRRLKVDDNNCGVCGNKCPPVDKLPPPHAHWGCVTGECGKLICDEGWGDCNGVEEDGCEMPIHTHENCAQCDDNCLLTGQKCINEIFKGGPACRCPAGTTFCGFDFITPWFGSCADFSSDRFNCGGCGRECLGNTQRSRGVCSFGECKLECVGRWNDCNGNPDDDCETDTFGDPYNCGGCGVTCDVEHGQACAGGRCVVEPCKEGESAR